MKDIAAALQLSKTTISWILSGKGEEKKFSEATIKRVKDYAERINYHPNLLARSLSLGTTNTVGLIIPFIDDTFYAQIAQSIEVEAEKRNYLLTVCSSDGNSYHEIDLIRILRSKQVDGLIIAPTKNSIQEIKRLKHDGFPFVLIDRYFPEINTNYIVVDNEDSSFQLINVLIKKGCKKIALLTSDLHLLVMGLRLKGYKKALKKANIPCNNDLIIQVQRNDYKKDIIKQLDALFKKHRDIDGFYFTTHYLAIEAIRYFLSRGINYNKHFRLACFHETEALDILAPKMIVARMPVNDIGKKAMDILLDNITQKTTLPKSMVLTNELTNL
ncbi:MAG: LacI family transcriptional regulator [Prevotellaceae bacterium]|jgi:LacI family transcriptional regulator|nr:LacI family transcriptional regulator [Prevotellaceae bacterium]